MAVSDTAGVEEEQGLFQQTAVGCIVGGDPTLHGLVGVPVDQHVGLSGGGVADRVGEPVLDVYRMPVQEQDADAVYRDQLEFCDFSVTP